jgi:hypothetical protein
MLLKKQYFASPPVDEVSLFQKADEMVSAYAERLIPYDALLKINDRNGIDLATAALYRSLLSITSCRGFKEEIDSLSVAPEITQKTIKVLLVPGMFYKEYPDIGSGGNLIVEIAEKFGYDIEQIQTESLGSPSDNKSKVAEHILSNNSAENLWLISVSRGGAEVRMALHDIGAENMPSNFRGWINISGTLNGTPLADRKFTSKTQSYLHLAFCKAVGISTTLAKDSRTTSEL